MLFEIGFLLSTLFKEESTAMQAGIGSFYPLMMLSGILWPIEGKILKNSNEKHIFQQYNRERKMVTYALFFILHLRNANVSKKNLVLSTVYGGDTSNEGRDDKRMGYSGAISISRVCF